MEWIVYTIVASLLCLWLWKALQNNTERRRRKLKAAELVRLIRPTFEKVYSQLKDEIRSEYPLIPFQFPTQEEILANSENIFLLHRSRDTAKLIKNILDPIIVRAKKDFMSYKPNFVSEEIIPAEKGSRLLPDQSVQSEVDLRNPPDWDGRRQTVYNRDRGRCKRCGVSVPLSKCNIHHLVRRSSGGGHSIDNLITLCRDCHGLMPGHEIVTGGPFYALPLRYTIHKRHCQFSFSGNKISGSLPNLIARGYSPCGKCMPGFSPLSRERTVWIEIYARSRLKTIVNSLVR